MTNNICPDCQQEQCNPGLDCCGYCYDIRINGSPNGAPKKLGTFMYALMKEARRDSLTDFLDNWNISNNDFDKIEQWFKEELNIKL